MTIKLFYDNPYQRQFQATIQESGRTRNGVPYVILDRTAFYPTGGGQPCDLGEIYGVSVIHVEEVEGFIRHDLASELPIDIKEVEAHIDWNRRWDHMQQHTGQHILSAAFAQLYGAETVGFHLGRDVVTIDVNVDEFNNEMLHQAMKVANQVVMENREILARFMSEEELKPLTLSKLPTVTDNIRIVSIKDFDHNPCGGTHPDSTGQVGPIFLLGWERNKGGVRIEFICGTRAVESMQKKQSILSQLSRHLSSPEDHLLNEIVRTQTQLKETEALLQEIKEKGLEKEAEQLIKAAKNLQGYRVSHGVFENLVISDLQKIAQKITLVDPLLIGLLLSIQGDKIQFVFAAGHDVKVDMNQLLKEVLPMVEGKGGGRPQSAQGGGVLNRPVEEVLAISLDRLQSRM